MTGIYTLPASRLAFCNHDAPKLLGIVYHATKRVFLWISGAGSSNAQLVVVYHAISGSSNAQPQIRLTRNQIGRRAFKYAGLEKPNTRAVFNVFLFNAFNSAPTLQAYGLPPRRKRRPGACVARFRRGPKGPNRAPNHHHLSARATPASGLHQTPTGPKVCSDKLVLPIHPSPLSDPQNRLNGR